MTACHSKGKKKKYAYYSCFNGSCPHGRRSIPRADVHKGIEKFLASLSPDATSIQIFEAFVDEAWRELSSDLTQRIQSVKNDINNTERMIGSIIGRIIEEQDPEVSAALRRRLKELQGDRQRSEAKRQSLLAVKDMGPNVFEHSRHFLSNPLKVWNTGASSVKRALLRACFAEPLRYAFRRGFRTPKLTTVFSALKDAEGGELYLVEPRGVEPLTS